MRYGIWTTRLGYVVDLFSGFIDAESADEAIEAARNKFPDAISVNVAERPVSRAAAEFWGNVQRSLTTDIDSQLELGRREADNPY